MTMNEKISIGIAEDHGLVRAGLIRMLHDYSNIKILFESSNGKELLKHLSEFKPQIVLLDIAMPLLGGIKAMEKMREKYPKIKIIVISAFAEETSITEYVRFGANAFLNKDCSENDLIKTIFEVKEKGSYFDNDVKKMLLKHGFFTKAKDTRELTERELHVLRLLCDNLSSAEIAAKMDIKENSVRWYKHILLEKTNCKNSRELISYAAKMKLIGS